MLSLPSGFSVEPLLPNAVTLLLVLLALALFGARRSPTGSRRMAPWVRALALLGAVWAYALSAPGLARGLLTPLEQFRPAVDLATVQAGADIVLLASGSVERHEGRAVVRLDRAAWERTAAAAALWQRSRARLFVVGGPLMDGLSPARAMADAAIAWGVPADRVVVDDRATTTRDSYDRLPALAASPQPWLVTSASHMRRALWSAEQKGLSLRAFPCDYLSTDPPGWQQWLPSTFAVRQNAVALHEWVGLLAYRISAGR
jgi:uncharacterized SAM-binding protein YcdF (DUF218 family)